MDPKCSVIIPIYNTRDYLAKCIESIQRQKERNIEIILVDDGSTDGSSTICDGYAENDNRIQVIHQKNKGVSAARNAGLAIAKGEWIAFVDSDDEADENYLTIPDNVADADVIQKPFYRRNGNGLDYVWNSKNGSILSKQDDIYRHFCVNRNNALWDKLFKKGLIVENKFEEKVSIGEDFIFFCGIIHRIKKYGFCDCGFYIQNVHAASVMNSLDRKTFIGSCVDNIYYVKKHTTSIPLQNSIIYKTLVNHIYKERSILSVGDLDNLFLLVKKMQLKDLKYVNLLSKIKLIFLKLTILYKR